MLLRDASTPQNVRTTGAGYLVADVLMARAGLYQYAGREVGRPDLGTVTVYRPVSEVFRSKAMASFAHVPVTLGHPSAGISADTWRRDAVGEVTDEVRRQGDFMGASIIVRDRAAIDRIRAGTAELSCGYDCELDWTSGVTDAGKPYDAIQRRIAGNHLAIVDRGRAGSACRIGSTSKGA